MRYALDLAALPIGTIVIAVDCWGEAPIAIEVTERDTHHIIGRSAAGAVIFVAGPLIRRMATETEAAAFAPAARTAPQTPAPVLSPKPQMELF